MVQWFFSMYEGPCSNPWYFKMKQQICCAFFYPFLGGCHETGSKGNEEGIQASQNWTDWGELSAGILQDVYLRINVVARNAEKRDELRGLLFTSVVTSGKGRMLKASVFLIANAEIPVPHTVIMQVRYVSCLQVLCPPSKKILQWSPD